MASQMDYRHDSALDEFKSSIQSNFGGATKYKFSKDVIANLIAIINLFDEIKEHESRGLDYVKALILKICGATGEYIDLLAQPYTNSFGYYHNTKSGVDGINCTIDKIIEDEFKKVYNKYIIHSNFAK